MSTDNMPSIYRRGEALLSSARLKIELDLSKKNHMMTEEFAAMCLYLAYITLHYKFKTMSLEDIQDIMCIFMIKLQRKYHMLIARTGTRSYLKTMINNTAIDYMRKQQTHKRKIDALTADQNMEFSIHYGRG